MGAEEWPSDGLGVSGCTRCSALVESRSQIVNGVGPNDADVLIVGEAPGAEEDRRGEPFVGRSGTILTDTMAAAGLDRDLVRITNCVRCRPPDNRDPQAAELDHCREWLEAEILAIDPTIILAVGKVPASHLLDRTVRVTDESGTVEHIHLEDKRYPVVICVHPAAILYDRSQEERLEEAIATAAQRVGVTPPGDDQVQLDQF